MKLENLVQFGFVVAIWVIFALLMAVLFAFDVLLRIPASAWFYRFTIIVAAVFTFLVITPYTWEIIVSEGVLDLRNEMDRELSKLSDTEVLEVLQALDEVREETGIDIQFPVNNKRAKRAQVGDAVRRLSDTELVHLKEQLRNGEIEEEKLMAWLEAQQEMDMNND